MFILPTAVMCSGMLWQRVIKNKNIPVCSHIRSWPSQMTAFVSLFVLLLLTIKIDWWLEKDCWCWDCVPVWGWDMRQTLFEAVQFCHGFKSVFGVCSHLDENLFLICFYILWYGIILSNFPQTPVLLYGMLCNFSQGPLFASIQMSFSEDKLPFGHM